MSDQLLFGLLNPRTIGLNTGLYLNCLGGLSGLDTDYMLVIHNDFNTLCIAVFYDHTPQYSEIDMTAWRDYTVSVFENDMTVRRDYTMWGSENDMTVWRDYTVSVFEIDMTVRRDYTQSIIETDMNGPYLRPQIYINIYYPSPLFSVR